MLSGEIQGSAAPVPAIPSPYLMLVSFSSGDFVHFDASKINALNNSPYHGVAIPLVDAYDVETHSVSDFKPALSRMQNLKSDPWPWIFWNRLVGTTSEIARKFPQSPSSKPYFTRIQGMDLYDQTGALTDFLRTYRQALQVAKNAGAPGIVIDMEVYNNYELYDVDAVAKSLHQDPSKVKARLHEIGKQLTNIAQTEYPDATLWFLFTGLGETPDPQRYRSVTHVVAGILERAKEVHSQIKVVSGGELAGYCHRSPEALQDRLDRRARNFAPALSNYPNLHLGGTIAPWDGSAPRTGWMMEDTCKDSNAKNLGDFSPMFQALLSTYEYVWVYAADEAPYLPYSARAQNYNSALTDALSKTATARNQVGSLSLPRFLDISSLNRLP